MDGHCRRVVPHQRQHQQRMGDHAAINISARRRRRQRYSSCAGIVASMSMCVVMIMATAMHLPLIVGAESKHLTMHNTNNDMKKQRLLLRQRNGMKHSGKSGPGGGERQLGSGKSGKASASASTKSGKAPPPSESESQPSSSSSMDKAPASTAASTKSGKAPPPSESMSKSEPSSSSSMDKTSASTAASTKSGKASPPAESKSQPSSPSSMDESHSSVASKSQPSSSSSTDMTYSSSGDTTTNDSEDGTKDTVPQPPAPAVPGPRPSRPPTPPRMPSTPGISITPMPTVAKMQPSMSMPPMDMESPEEMIRPSSSTTNTTMTSPSQYPTESKSMMPSIAISGEPSQHPTIRQSSNPSGRPSTMPTVSASHGPSMMPSAVPSTSPTIVSTSSHPSMQPSAMPTTSTITTATPTLSPTTVAPTVPVNTATIRDVGMDLFGLPSLNKKDKSHYQKQTALFIEEFYNNKKLRMRMGVINDNDDEPRANMNIISSTETGNSPSVKFHGMPRFFGHRSLQSTTAMPDISNVKVAEFDLTEEINPTGSTSGTDCELIDPLSVTFTAEMTYVTGDDVSAEEILSYPFSTAGFQLVYINDYLKADGKLLNLVCVSDIKLPGEEGTLAADDSSAPSLQTAGMSPVPSPGPTTKVVTNSPSTTNVTSLQPSPGLTNSTTGLTDGSDALGGEITDFEMDLYGVTELKKQGIKHYEEQTALYIEEFYNGGSTMRAERPSSLRYPGRHSFGHRSLQSVPDDIVTNITVSISVTDEIKPTGSISGTDCSEIDPLVVSFSIELNYYSAYSDVNMEFVATYPFSKEEFQQQYIKYLQANDDEGTFDNLLCVSEVWILSSVFPTYYPTQQPDLANSTSSLPIASAGSAAPTLSPAAETDDIFNGIRSVDDVFGDLRVAEPTAYERKCNDNLRTVAQEDIDEFELSFVFAVESTSPVSQFLYDLEVQILDFVAISALRCTGGSDAQAVQMWRRDGGNIDDDEAYGLVRIRYPEFGEISSISECEVVSPLVNSCSVLDTKFVITSVGIERSEVRRGILLILTKAFEENALIEFVPELLMVTYLGPHPDALVAAGSTGADDNSTTHSSTLLAVLFSVCCVVLLLQLIICAAGRTNAFKKARSLCCRKHNDDLARSEPRSLTISNQPISKRYEIRYSDREMLG